jgi:hypothetical protein
VIQPSNLNRADKAGGADRGNSIGYQIEMLKRPLAFLSIQRTMAELS